MEGPLGQAFVNLSQMTSEDAQLQQHPHLQHHHLQQPQEVEDEEAVQGVDRDQVLQSQQQQQQHEQHRAEQAQHHELHLHPEHLTPEGQASPELHHHLQQHHHELQLPHDGAAEAQGALPSTPNLDLDSLGTQTEEEHQQAREMMINVLLPHIPAEASAVLFDAGYETLDAIRTLNVDLSDPSNDISSAEYYTKTPIKPGHKKLITQFVNGPAFVLDPSDPSHAGMIAALSAAQSPTHSAQPPAKKRRRISQKSPRPAKAELPVTDINGSQSGLPDLPVLLAALERHLADSPVTRGLRKDVDFKVTVQNKRNGAPGAEGIWKCMSCNSRPVTISLRNQGRQPQLSNVGTHLKTVKHVQAISARSASTQFIAAAEEGSAVETAGPAAAGDAVAAAIAAVQSQLEQQQQHHQEQLEQAQQAERQLQQEQQQQQQEPASQEEHQEQQHIAHQEEHIPHQEQHISHQEQHIPLVLALPSADMAENQAAGDGAARLVVGGHEHDEDEAEQQQRLVAAHEAERRLAAERAFQHALLQSHEAMQQLRRQLAPQQHEQIVEGPENEHEHQHLIHEDHAQLS
ncbi:hypothetical protein BDZ88DRAFT_489092 [Geranomyces variabilis]|nr:hypothetical protein BDZ88DRAFT_489092 [Geranomyces variabilis]KAJ3133375.1 hypothetical protein HDU90_006324 [Geranomyces variabilis]